MNKDMLQKLAQQFEELGNEKLTGRMAAYLIRESLSIDPPKPTVMPGDPIVWRWKDSNMPYRYGIYESGGWTRTALGERVDLEKTYWKPARMVGHRQVAVNVSRVSGWPTQACEIVLAWKNSAGYIWETIGKGPVITREEAERMEAEE